MSRSPLNCCKAKIASQASNPATVADKAVENSAPAIATPLLERYTQEYLLDCDYRLQSPKTIETRRIFLKNLVWFLRHRGYESCSTTDLSLITRTRKA